MGNVCVKECYCNSFEEEDDEIIFLNKDQKNYIITRLSFDSKKKILFT